MKRFKKIHSRIAAFLLAVMMVLSVVPMDALAADGDDVKGYLAELRIMNDMADEVLLENFEPDKYEYTITLPADQTSVTVGALLSDAAMEDSTITAKYLMKMFGYEFESSQVIQSEATGGTYIGSIVERGMQGAEFTVEVGLDDDIQVYKINVKRNIVVKETLKDAEGNVLTKVGDTYIVPKNSESINVQFNPYGAELKVNGEVKDGTAFDLTPVYENNKAEIKVEASYEGETLTKTYKLQKRADGDTLTGTCGEDATWTLKDGVLTISGTGAMKDFGKGGAEYSAPWYSFADEIKSAVIEEGITAVGTNAFSFNYGSGLYPNLTEVTIPKSVTSIGMWAFENSTVLENVNYAGTQEEWNAITISETGNDPLIKVKSQTEDKLPAPEITSVTVKDTDNNVLTEKEGVYVIPVTSETVTVTVVTPNSETVKVNDTDAVNGSATVTPVYGEDGTFTVTILVSNTEETITKTIVLKKGELPIPVIEKQPVNGTAEIGTTPSPLTFSFKLDNVDETKSYQWYMSKDGENFTPIEGATERTYTPPTTELGMTYYYVKGIATFNNMTSSVDSNVVMFVVKGSEDFIGSGTENDPFMIYSLDDLRILQENVNEKAMTYEGVTFQMGADFEIPKDFGQIGCLMPGKTDAANGKNIQPFSGIFDGAGHTLTYEKGSEAVFGYVREAVIKNLNMKGDYIEGNGLVKNYVVDYGTDGSYNIGNGGSYSPGCPDTVDIINVTIKSGTIISGSGFLGGAASGGNVVNIVDCTIEKDVKIGCKEDGTSAENSYVGSFAGEFAGTIKNCVSYADVYGMNNIGGIVAKKAQSMGPMTMENCEFHGAVYATGNRVGGIAGTGYNSESAPNTATVSIINCVVTGDIYGTDYIGGIFGGEYGVEQTWDNGIGYITGNRFTGKIHSDGKVIGGIIGFMQSMNRYNVIENNYYEAGCGAEKGIGGVTHIDTSGVEFGVKDGVLYYDTSSDSLDEIKKLVDGENDPYRSVDSENHNRTDDPLGADADKLATSNKDEFEEPSNPSNPSKPDEPANPDNPANPDDPSNPDSPTNPDDPSNPEYVLSEATKAVIAKIDALTGDDEAAIIDAYKAYTALTPDERLFVDNYSELEALTKALGQTYHYDEATGVDLRDNNEIVLPWYVKLVVEKTNLTNMQIKKMQKTLGEDAKTLATYDIFLINVLTGEKYAVQGTVHVKVPAVDKGYYKSMIGVHYISDTKVEFLELKEEGESLAFDTNSFSAFAIAGTMLDYDDIVGILKNPVKTGDDSAIWLTVTLAATAAFAGMLILKRRREYEA